LLLKIPQVKWGLPPKSHRAIATHGAPKSVLFSRARSIAGMTIMTMAVKKLIDGKTVDAHTIYVYQAVSDDVSLLIDLCMTLLLVFQTEF
jgi:hypothetical protein